MAVGRKESNTLMEKAGKAIVDLAFNLASRNAISNAACSEGMRLRNVCEYNGKLYKLNLDGTRGEELDVCSIPQKVAESPSTGTYGTKLDSLYNAFEALPQWKKERAVIRVKNNGSDVDTYRSIDPVHSRFCNPYSDSGSIANINIFLRSSGSTISTTLINSYSQFSYSNDSASTNSRVFELWA